MSEFGPDQAGGTVNGEQQPGHGKSVEEDYHQSANYVDHSRGLQLGLVETPINDLTKCPMPILLRFGRSVHVDVVTGSRSLLSYFFAPLKKIIGNSLRQR